MKDAEGIRQVAGLITKYRNEPLVVVVSALGKSTNTLEKLLRYALNKNYKQTEETFVSLRRFHFEIAEALFGDARNHVFDDLDSVFVSLNQELKEISKDRYLAYDQVVCKGELLSSTIVHAFLKTLSLPCHLVDARTLIFTNSNYTTAEVDWKFTQKTIKARLEPILNSGEFALTQGFIGADHHGIFTTLGREGSDFTAAILANVLDAGEVSIWKDVPGLMNADPKRFDDTVKLDNISYHEAIELAFYGASVVHPKTIQPVQHKNIPLKVRSFYKPDSTPSEINNETSADDQVHKVIVKDKQVLLSIGSRDLTFIAEENLTRIFKAFSKHKIHVNLMQHSAVSFSVCFKEDKDKLQALIKELKEDFSIRYNTGLTLITIRYYTDDIINQFTSNKRIYLEQKSRITVQLLFRD